MIPYHISKQMINHFAKKKKTEIVHKRVDDTIAVALDIELEDPAGKISHLIRVEFPCPVTFISRTYKSKRVTSAKSP